MTRLVWGVDGTRTFEAGVDRGVLYLPSAAGVPWSGLKAVKEAPSGGTPQPYYQDGIKHANISTAEEYNATLDAFSAPPEFAVCDGSVLLAAGLFATQQPRKPFGLSYRTRVGNDLKGLAHGYKIHLVYNALAAPAARDNNTQGQAAEVMNLSWAISTRPPLATTYKPTAHLVIDTRDLDPEVLSLLEDTLYGDSDTTPSLPTQAAIISMLS
jgi:hypothetical protein